MYALAQSLTGKSDLDLYPIILPVVDLALGPLRATVRKGERSSADRSERKANPNKTPSWEFHPGDFRRASTQHRLLAESAPDLTNITYERVVDLTSSAFIWSENFHEGFLELRTDTITDYLKGKSAHNVKPKSDPWPAPECGGRADGDPLAYQVEDGVRTFCEGLDFDNTLLVPPIFLGEGGKTPDGKRLTAEWERTVGIRRTIKGIRGKPDETFQPTHQLNLKIRIADCNYKIPLGDAFQGNNNKEKIEDCKTKYTNMANTVSPPVACVDDVHGHSGLLITTAVSL